MRLVNPFQSDRGKRPAGLKTTVRTADILALQAALGGTP
jgi:hypothetical protein